MRLETIAVAGLLCALLAVGGALAEPEPGGSELSAKQRDIARLIELTGDAEQTGQVLDQVFALLKQGQSDVSDETWALLREEFDPAEMNRLLIPIYARHYTHHEILGLLAFYETPLGRKSIAVMPAITQETLALAAAYADRVTQRLLQRLEETGHAEM